MFRSLEEYIHDDSDIILDVSGVMQVENTVERLQHQLPQLTLRSGGILATLRSRGSPNHCTSVLAMSKRPLLSQLKLLKCLFSSGVISLGLCIVCCCMRNKCPEWNRPGRWKNHA